jgi:hypothetical protein
MRVRSLMLVMAVMTLPRVTAAQDVDSALSRVERLVIGGDRSSARVLADSLLVALPPESPRIADVLYWRAQSATNAADAERDYLRITVEHPFRKRAPDALLALGQLELARGDRGAARRRFDRLLRDYPNGKHVVRASLLSGRLALEDRDYAAGCATLNAARPLVAPNDIELRNQFDYVIPQCDRIVTDSVAAVAQPVQPPAEAAGPEFSVQVAAYNVRREASSLAARLTERGFDARVFGDKAPWRVRIGRYATRAEATAALARVRAARLNGMVVEAEKR